MHKLSGGAITVVAGTGKAGYSGDNGPAQNAQLNSPAGLAVDDADNLYIADQNNGAIRKVANGTITTVAARRLELLQAPARCHLHLDRASLRHSSASGSAKALNLTLGDIDLRRRVIEVREGKFKKSRYVLLSSSTVNQMRAYLERRRKAGFSTAATAPCSST